MLSTKSSDFDSEILVTAAVVHLAVCVSSSFFSNNYWYWVDKSVALYVQK